ncbi:Histone deacetylase complex subunit SAP30 -like protein, partial [Trichinella zimbabwensis]
LILNIFIMSPEDIMYYSRPSSDLLNIERASKMPSFPVIPWAQPKGRLHCFIHEDGQPCHRPATSFISSKRIKKLLAKSNLKLISKSEASHVYVCNMHKKQLDSERSDINSEDANTEETITGYSLIRACFDRMAPRAIRRYKKANNLSTDPASTRDEVLDILAKHALSSPVNEKECIAQCVLKIKFNTVKDIRLLCCMLLQNWIMNFMFTVIEIFALLSYNFNVLEAQFGNFHGLCLSDVSLNYSIKSMKLSDGICMSLNKLHSNNFSASCHPGHAMDASYLREEELLNLNDNIVDFVDTFGNKAIAFPAYIIEFPFTLLISELNLEEHLKVGIMSDHTSKIEFVDYSCETILEYVICTPPLDKSEAPLINVTSLYEARSKFAAEKRPANTLGTDRIATYFEIALKTDSQLSSPGIDVKINHFYESMFNVSYVICISNFLDNCAFFDRDSNICTFCKPNFMGNLCADEIIYRRYISCNNLNCGAAGQCVEMNAYSTCMCYDNTSDKDYSIYQKLFWILSAMGAFAVFWLTFVSASYFVQRKKGTASVSKGPESEGSLALSSNAEEIETPATAAAAV